MSKWGAAWDRWICIWIKYPRATDVVSQYLDNVSHAFRATYPILRIVGTSDGLNHAISMCRMSTIKT